MRERKGHHALQFAIPKSKPLSFLSLRSFLFSVLPALFAHSSRLPIIPMHLVFPTHSRVNSPPPSLLLIAFQLACCRCIKEFSKGERERREERGRSAECQMRLSLVRRVHNTVCGGARSFGPVQGLLFVARARDLHDSGGDAAAADGMDVQFGGTFASGHFWSRCLLLLTNPLTQW